MEDISKRQKRRKITKQVNLHLKQFAEHERAVFESEGECESNAELT